LIICYRLYHDSIDVGQKQRFRRLWTKKIRNMENW